MEQQQAQQAGDGQSVENGSELEGEAGQEADKVSRASGHHYPVYVVHLALEQILHSLNSLRGSQKTFELFSQYFAVDSPSYSSIRQWLLRVGLYELQQKPGPGPDWIMMLDMTLELGHLKCLVILGLPASELEQSGYALGHHHVQVLEVAVLSSSSGEMVAQRLTELSQQLGRPLQIISDQGSDIKKGVSLYQQQHPEVIWTYDVTHQMALLLKKELAEDERTKPLCGIAPRAVTRSNKPRSIF